MSRFDSGPSTVGAGKSGAQSEERMGPDDTWVYAAIALGLFLLSPITFVVGGVGMVYTQINRTPWQRALVGALVTSLIGAVMVGFSPMRAIEWHGSGTLTLWSQFGLPRLLQEGIDAVASLMGSKDPWLVPMTEGGFGAGLLRTLPIAVPAGTWITCTHAFWAAYRRSPLDALEGKKFDQARPEDLWDRKREQRNRAKIRNGQAVDMKRRTVAVGIGRYGHLATMAVATMKRPILVFGGPRQGKALDVDTPIPTPEGWTRMGDLRVGDTVFDESGKPCRVDDVFDQPPNRRCYEVEFSDGSTLVADEEHLWWTQTRSHRRSIARAAKRGERKTTGTPEQVAAVRAVADSESSAITLAELVAAADHHDAVVRGWVNHLPRIGSVGRQRLYPRNEAVAVVAERLAGNRNDQSARRSGNGAVVTTAQIAATLHHGGGGANHSIPVAHPLALPDRDLPVDPYLLGVWLGDGSRQTAAIFTADPEIVTAVEATGITATRIPGDKYGYSLALPPLPKVGVQQCLACNYRFTPSLIGTLTCSPKCSAATRGNPQHHQTPGCEWCGSPLSPHATRLVCTSCQRSRGTVTAMLRTAGVLNNKHIPTDYLRASEAQRRALLAGLLDTDGTVSGCGQAQFDNTNERLANDVHELIASLGYRPTVFQKRATLYGKDCGPVYRVSFTTDDDVFRLERKRLAHKDRTRNFSPAKNANRSITAVRPVTSRAVRCITVNSPSHLYLAGRSMIPTHNTQGAINVIAQTATMEGGGWLIIDFKGDEEVPQYAAAWAAAHGRKFKHFQLTDKNGEPYRAPHADVSPNPAYYDPLRRGNATSKTDMLVNSVGRDGDAAAYFRAAYELTQVIYQVASLTGYDRDKGGFRVLEDLLDLDHLQKVADTVGPDGRGMLADHPGLRTRVEKMVNTFKRNDILRGAANDLATLLSTYGNGPAAGPWLKPGPTSDSDIDLHRAVVENEVVVFSLSVQDYGALAKNIGTLVLLDAQNTIAQLRSDLGRWRKKTNTPDAPPPWLPFNSQIEEFGSAGADAILDVLNKSGDVNWRTWLSTQSWHDVVAVDGTGTFARRVLDQAGNFLVFGINDELAAEVFSGVTPSVTKAYARSKQEFSAGALGFGLKAANLGKIDVHHTKERQVPPGAFQTLPTYHCIWIAKHPDLRVAHTFEAGANHWWEVISTEPVLPAAGAINPVPNGRKNPAIVAVAETPAAASASAESALDHPPVLPPETPVSASLGGARDASRQTRQTAAQRSARQPRPARTGPQDRIAPTVTTKHDEPPVPEPDPDTGETGYEDMYSRYDTHQKNAPARTRSQARATGAAPTEKDRPTQKKPGTRTAKPAGADLDEFDQFN